MIIKYLGKNGLVNYFDLSYFPMFGIIHDPDSTDYVAYFSDSVNMELDDSTIMLFYPKTLDNCTELVQLVETGLKERRELLDITYLQTESILPDLDCIN